MAKNKKFRFPWFAFALVLYAVVFLVGTCYSLKWFWGYMDAFEQSQPEHAIENYMASISNDTFYEGSADLIAQLDSNLITQEECHAMIDQAVSGGVTYARNRKESSTEKNVYMLLSGEHTIGKVVSQPGEPDEHGFRVWSITEESFDFSFLMGTGKTVTVPHNFTVTVNGIALDESYITQNNIQYASLKDYYEEYEGLPCMVTYETPGIWGSQAMLITDPEGNIVTIDENTDMEAFVNNCTAEELSQIQSFSTDFINQYMVFVSCYNSVRKQNYKALIEYIVDDAPLENRMYEAMDGLQWVTSQDVTVLDVKINRCTNIGGGRYLCDLTYITETVRYVGTTQDATNTKIILVESGGKLLAESMQNY